ncbi:LacI family DNA-binding transcriptional regulator [Jannaschia sp.]|nr:LacI family DNA-binding transcriptional regulator [Jannaschia sp.]
MGTRITMRDVADTVGVSPMTVSRAFRDDGSVSAGTRARIRAAADRLGYVYDSTATAFRTRKSGFIAVTLPSVNNANFAETYRGLTDALAGSGMQFLLGATNYRVENEEELVRQLLTRNPEALVVTGGHHTDATRALIAAQGVPTVEMWDLPAQPLGHAVGFANAEAMAPLVAHLAQTGRRRLAFVGASEGADHRGAERRRGVVEAARALGLPEVVLLDAGPAPVSMRHGAALIEARGAGGLAGIDALVCVSDPVAFGVLSACRRLGVAVPEDMAVTGFGKFEIATVSEPRITTVDVGARRIGEEVAIMLDTLFRGEAPPARVDIGAMLVPGGTA